MITANNLSFTPMKQNANAWLVGYVAQDSPHYSLALLEAVSSDIRVVSYRIKWLGGANRNGFAIAATKDQAVTAIVNYYNARTGHGSDYNWDDYED